VKHMEPQDKIHEHFKRLDRNGDGALDVDELSQLLMEMGTSKKQAISEAKAIISTSDTDGSGAIEFDEFTQNWQRQLLTENEAYIRAVFSVLDEDGGGTIDATELANVLDMHEEGDRQRVNEIIKEVDADGDGVISYEEFREAMVENTSFNNKGAHVGHQLRMEDIKRASMALADVDIDGVEEVTNEKKKASTNW
jgi:Ca2+-binding EF-hand superfamily protein